MLEELSEEDLDALYAVVRTEIPRITRENFAGILAQQIERGILELTVTDTEITLRLPDVPETGVYRVERKRRLH